MKVNFKLIHYIISYSVAGMLLFTTMRNIDYLTYNQITLTFILTLIIMIYGDIKLLEKFYITELVFKDKCRWRAKKGIKSKKKK